MWYDKIFKYGYTGFDKLQKTTFRKYVKGKSVIDIGCGNGELANLSIKTGATSVYAIDKEFNVTPKLTPNVTYLKTTFDKFYTSAKRLKFDISILSWPINNTSVLTGLELALFSPEIILITNNSDGVVCGLPIMYEMLSKLQIEAYIPQYYNVLTIYKNLPCDRNPTQEELRGMSDKIERFKEEPYYGSETWMHTCNKQKKEYWSKACSW